MRIERWWLVGCLLRWDAEWGRYQQWCEEHPVGEEQSMRPGYSETLGLRLEVMGRLIKGMR